MFLMKDNLTTVTQPEWLIELRLHLGKVLSPDAGENGRRILVETLAKIDALLSSRRDAMPSELAHFLERRSYEKARQYCENNTAISRGSCSVSK